MESKARITAIGAYVPPKKLTNDDLSTMVDTSDEWIVKRTGIKERRIAENNVFASDLAVNAVQNLISTSDASLDEVDMIIATTFTADYLTPSVAAVVQGRLGLPTSVATIDMNAACAGFVHALYAAQAYVTVGMCRKVLVVSSEVMSKIVDFTDRNTCILFGDGAAALLIEPSNTAGFLGVTYGSFGSMADKLYCTGLSKIMNGSPLPVQGYFWQDGRAVYNFSIKTVPEGMRLLCENAEISMDQLDWFVPHSANSRMIESICEKLSFPVAKTLMSVEPFGNTSSVSIPLALWLAVKDGRLQPGHLLALYGFGGGLNHAGIIVRW
jgi:3-oxoacyl-[acyl-carrier-protein] synthase-3